MTESEFRQHASHAGYGEPELIEREGGRFNDEHTHDFSVSALVLEGELCVTTKDGEKTTCGAGDLFELSAGIAHCEQYGPQGACVLVARRDT